MKFLILFILMITVMKFFYFTAIKTQLNFIIYSFNFFLQSFYFQVENHFFIGVFASINIFFCFLSATHHGERATIFWNMYPSIKSVLLESFLIPHTSFFVNYVYCISMHIICEEIKQNYSNFR